MLKLNINRESAFRLVLLFLMFFVFLGCKGKGKSTPQMPKEEPQTFNVVIHEVAKGSISNYIKLGGDVTTETNIDVYPNISYGKVLKINAIIGKRVRKGETLVVVDPSLPGSTFAPNSVVAPISGYVTALYAQVGAVVSNATPVARVGVLDNPSDIYVKSYVPEKYVSLVRPGMRADVQFSYSSEPHSARVREISPLIDPASRTFEIWLRFLRYDASIKVGSFPDIKLYIEEKSDIIKVPLEAVLTRGEEKSVFLYDDSDPEKPAVAHQRLVQCGIRIDGEYEIIDGLKEGEKLIVKGHSLLVEGAFVRDINQIQEHQEEDTASEENVTQSE